MTAWTGSPSSPRSTPRLASGQIGSIGLDPFVRSIPAVPPESPASPGPAAAAPLTPSSPRPYFLCIEDERGVPRVDQSSASLDERHSPREASSASLAAQAQRASPRPNVSSPSLFPLSGQLVSARVIFFPERICLLIQ